MHKEWYEEYAWDPSYTNEEKLLKELTEMNNQLKELDTVENPRKIWEFYQEKVSLLFVSASGTTVSTDTPDLKQLCYYLCNYAFEKVQMPREIQNYQLNYKEILEFVADTSEAAEFIWLKLPESSQIKSELS